MSTALYAILSFLLFAIGLLFIVISVLKARDRLVYGFLHILAYPLWFGALWLFVTGVLGWHFASSSDSNDGRLPALNIFQSDSLSANGNEGRQAPRPHQQADAMSGQRERGKTSEITRRASCIPPKTAA